jgi:hypothetical protein
LAASRLIVSNTVVGSSLNVVLKLWCAMAALPEWRQAGGGAAYGGWVAQLLSATTCLAVLCD